MRSNWERPAKMQNFALLYKRNEADSADDNINNTCSVEVSRFEITSVQATAEAPPEHGWSTVNHPSGADLLKVEFLI